jgi:hypothetical protein
MRLKVFSLVALSLALAACSDVPTAARSALSDSPRHGFSIGGNSWLLSDTLVSATNAATGAVVSSIPLIVPAGESRAVTFEIRAQQNSSQAPTATLEDLAVSACSTLPLGFVCTAAAPVGDAANSMTLQNATLAALSGDYTTTVTITVRNPDVCGVGVGGTLLNIAQLTQSDFIVTQATASVDVYAAECAQPTTISTLGCSPGYWKNHNFPTPYIKSTTFNFVFTSTAFGAMTMQQVLAQNGGGLAALGRQTAGAFFNAAILTGFPYSKQQIVAKFNAAYLAGPTAYAALQKEFEGLTDVSGRSCPNPTGK